MYFVKLFILLFIDLPWLMANPQNAGKSCQHTATSFHCVIYVSNYDADTVKVTIPNVHPLLGEKIAVRVAGIDAAELRTKDACEKKRATQAQLEVAKILSTAKRIDLNNVKRGKYFRIVADVIVDNHLSLSQWLVKRGYAYFYDGGTKKKINWCLPMKKDLQVH